MLTDDQFELISSVRVRLTLKFKPSLNFFCMMNNLTHYRCVDSSKRSKSEDAPFFIEIQMQIIALEDPIDILLVRGRNRRPKM